MAKIIDQFSVKNYTILCLNINWFDRKLNFTQIEIEGKKYKAEICSGLHTSIAIEAQGNFIGKKVKFLQIKDDVYEK